LARALATLFALALAAQGARAGTLGGSLDAAAESADLYQVTCSDDGRGAPASLAAQVGDAAPVAAPLVSVQIQRGAAATNATDATDGDAGLSPLTFVNGGAGLYFVFVAKTGPGAESYTLTYQCMTGANGGGVATGTSISPSGDPVPEVPALPLLGLVLLALALGGASVAAAHTQNGSLGADASATDFYQVNCSDDGSGTPGSLVLEVLDAAPVAAPLVSVQIRKGSLLTNTTDAVDGDSSWSPLVFLNGGGGVYDVLVDKSGAGAESYSLDYHCVTGANGGGVHTGTSIQVRQNQ
jgi:hypothetical protein